MKAVFSIRGALFAAVLLGAALSSCPAADLNAMTFNIRNSAANDGSNGWSNRREMAAEVFKKEDVDLAGLQEVLRDQLLDLEKRLPDYAWIGVGRDDGRQAGEYAPIFYRKSAFRVLKQGTFWLSETPDKPGSTGWDAALPRIATWGLFQRAADGRKIFFINTHLDHKGVQARREAARLIVEKIAELAGGNPVIAAGDFNSLPDSDAVKAMLSSKKMPLLSSRDIAPAGSSRASGTFNGFGSQKSDATIDYIFVSPGTGVTRCEPLEIIENSVFVSDHWPLVAALKLPVGA